VCYDISDDRRRTEIFRLLRDHGDHVQYSVFFCELTAMELIGLKASLTDNLNQKKDQVILLDLGEAVKPLDLSFACLGKAYTPVNRVLVV
jgi:CRISPR-associated protein Cas2